MSTYYRTLYIWYKKVLFFFFYFFIDWFDWLILTFRVYCPHNWRPTVTQLKSSQPKTHQLRTRSACCHKEVQWSTGHIRWHPATMTTNDSKIETKIRSSRCDPATSKSLFVFWEVTRRRNMRQARKNITQNNVTLTPIPSNNISPAGTLLPCWGTAQGAKFVLQTVLQRGSTKLLRWSAMHNYSFWLQDALQDVCRTMCIYVVLHIRFWHEEAN